jgi:hypothetical protein
LCGAAAFGVRAVFCRFPVMETLESVPAAVAAIGEVKASAHRRQGNDVQLSTEALSRRSVHAGLFDARALTLPLPSACPRQTRDAA